MDNKQLNPNQSTFFDLYLSTGNATDSYMKAYGQKSRSLAASAASQLLKKHKGVYEAILEKHGVTVQKVALRLGEALDANLYINGQNTNKSVPPDHKTRLRGIEISLKLLELSNEKKEEKGTVIIIKDKDQGVFKVGSR